MIDENAHRFAAIATIKIHNGHPCHSGFSCVWNVVENIELWVFTLVLLDPVI